MRLLVPVLAVLAYFLAVAGLHPQALSFDGLAFLMGARAGRIDYGHALYQPLLALAQALLGGSAPPERVGQAVSALGAALAFVFLVRRLERAGAPRSGAGLAAACFALSTLVWQEAGSIEPTSWTITALLVAGERAEGYGRRPTVVRLAALLLAFGAALGFHLVSVCALPWLVTRAWPERRRMPRSHLLLPVGGSALVFFLALEGGALGSYLRYWAGFVPDFDAGLLAQLRLHVARGSRLLFEGAPVLIGAACLAALLLAFRRPSQLVEGALLGGPYGLAFLVFGKPMVGLLVPVLLAAAFWLGRAPTLGAQDSYAATGAPTPRSRRLTNGILAGCVLLQLALTLPQALEWRRKPDEARGRAELFARYVPAGAVLFAGPLANHLLYYWPALEVVSLPELWHRVHAEERSSDPIEVVRQAVAASGRRCVLSSDGAGFLQGGLGADPARLGLSLSGAFLIPEDPRLALFPLGE